MHGDGLDAPTTDLRKLACRWLFPGVIRRTPELDADAIEPK
jgi:hypothetical protein